MTNKNEWTVEDMLEIAHRHAQAEADGDLEAVMATMADNPVYDFYPPGVHFTGLDNVRRYYTHVCNNMKNVVVGAVLINEWANETSVSQETEVTVMLNGEEKTFRVASVLELDADQQLIKGERIYSCEPFVKLLLGEIFNIY